MEFKRADRVGDLIRTEIADILHRKIKDPRVGFVTLTRVETSDDLRHARIFVSVLGDEGQKKDTLKGLKSASQFIRGELGKRLKLRCTPELLFIYDDSLEKGAKTLDLLRELEKEKEKEEEEEEEEG